MQQLTTRGWRKLKSVLQPLPPRARNDYATHVPVLLGLASLRRIERVLEFGCGNYSTKTFLNPAAFPELKELQSVENDRDWGETIRTAVKDDARCKIHITTGAMCHAVANFNLETFDLILVDDSTTAQQRASTIRALSLLCPLNPWTLIHDFEVDEYRRASSGFAHCFVFKAYNPQTGLVFNSMPNHDFKALDKLIRVNSVQLDPDDVTGWLRVIRK